MDALGGGYGGWWWSLPRRGHRPFRSQRDHSGSPEASGGGGFHFPFRQAATAASLALVGDTIAQIRAQYLRSNPPLENEPLIHSDDEHIKDGTCNLISNHDWLRALRMTSYGFLLYGPGSFAWYQYLDHALPKQTVENLLLKVLLNQIVLGPCVIAVVFAWNNLWQGKLSQLPKKYQNDALPTLLSGFRFWIPVSVLNFWLVIEVIRTFPDNMILSLYTRHHRVVPLHARVAFMSMGSIFWNFCLSSTMSK